jgi:hypothetical protein
MWQHEINQTMQYFLKMKSIIDMSFKKCLQIFHIIDLFNYFQNYSNVTLVY